jgi:site-specific recombinase XerD
LHDLRHEGVSRLFEKDFNVMEAASVSGHKDLRSLKRYTHLKAENLIEKMR